MEIAVWAISLPWLQLFVPRPDAMMSRVQQLQSWY